MGKQLLLQNNRYMHARQVKRAGPCQRQTDNGAGFISHVLQERAEQHGVEHHFIDPGKPME